jgi:hypothetical protein
MIFKRNIVSSSRVHGTVPPRGLNTNILLFGAARSLATTKTGNAAKDTTTAAATLEMESELVALRNRQRLQCHDSILQTIGSTPIIKLSNKMLP